MAKAKLNALLKSIKGSVDGLNIYQKGGQTIISPAGAPAKKRKPGEKERQGQFRLIEATYYSKGVKRTQPDLYARYVAVSKQRGCLPFTVSNGDWYHPPVVDAIDASAYRGLPGQLIRIRAHDDFEVRDVTVAIKSGDSTIETGLAVRQHDESWHYTATMPATGNVRIEATARDWPNHKASKVVSVDLSAPAVADDSPRARLIEKIRRAAQRRGSYLLKNGQTRVNHFDKYRLSHAPDLLQSLAQQLLPLIPPETEVLAGLELGGIPIATLLSQLTNKPLVLLRKQPRDWGTTLPAEGGDLAGRHLLPIVDVVQTGSQLFTTIRPLRSAGAILTHALCILDEQSGAPALLHKQGVALTSLFTTFELIATT